MRLSLLGALVALAPALAAGAEHWRLQYFYDAPDGAEFHISGLTFPSPQHGVAAGWLAEGGKAKPYAVASSDGGATWEPLHIPEAAISLFFLNDRTGWLVSPRNIWKTEDSGHQWIKAGRARDALRVYFRDERRGWAVGTDKSVYETSDGGATWTEVAAAAKPQTTPRYTVYSTIAFAGPKAGMIAGWSRPPRGGDAGRLPEWMDPENRRREWPGKGVMLQTLDGGATWDVSETSMFGRITSISLASDGRGLVLVQFFDRFEYPSEVYRVDASSNKPERVFRRQDRVVTDVLVVPRGAAYLAAVEPPGTLFHSPVPGKLKLLTSSNSSDWKEMAVDYRAVARRAVLAAAGPKHVWVATDTGMILQLVSE